MNETATTTETAPAAPTPKAAPRSKPAAKPAKKAPTKATPAKKAAANGTARKADRGMADVPAADRRLALVKLLRKVGATSSAAARPVGVLAEKLGYTAYDVYCLAYHKYHLAAEGIVKTTTVEGQRGLSVYLTAKGAKATDEQVKGK